MMKISSPLKFGLCCATAMIGHMGIMHALPSASHEEAALVKGGSIAVNLVAQNALAMTQLEADKSDVKSEPEPPKTAEHSPVPSPQDAPEQHQKTPPQKTAPKPQATSLPKPLATEPVTLSEPATPSEAAKPAKHPPEHDQDTHQNKDQKTTPTNHPVVPAHSSAQQPGAQIGNAATANYKGDVLKHLSRQRLPRANGSGSTFVSFTIAYSGDLERIEIAKSSGSRRFDRDAMKVVELAAPYPKPPTHANRDFNIEIEGK